MARRIVFINPPLSLKERYARLDGAGSVVPPLGLLYLASSAREKGYEPYFLDSIVEGWDIQQTAERALSVRPDFIGLTTTYLSNRYAVRIAREIRKRDRQVCLILGGPQVTAIPGEIISRVPEFDWFVLGEGEQTLVELLERLSSGRSPRDILGVGYHQGGRAVINPPRPQLEDLDRLPPPAFDLVHDFSLYEPSGDFLGDLPNATLITSRGCPLTCAFCDRSVFGNRWRFHSARYVVDMMKILHYRYGIRDITIWDDNYLVNKRRIQEICALLVRERMGLTYSCQASVNFAREDLMSSLRASGCWLIGWGLESGSQEILNRYEKHIRLEQSRRAVAMSREAGIQNNGYFIFGNPGESPETIRQTLGFIRELRLNHIQVHPLSPLPNTAFYREAENQGVFTQQWGTTGLIEVSYVPEGMTAQDIENACRKAYSIVYFAPWNFLRQFLRLFDARRPRAARKLARSAVSLLRYVLSRVLTAKGTRMDKPVLPPQEALDLSEG